MQQYPEKFQTIRNYFKSNCSCDDTFNSLNRGTAILETEEQLNYYLRSYGNMHEAKLQETFADLFEHFILENNTQLEIIDYACGQGLASIVLLNYIEEHFNYDINNLLKIKLIEPSTIALNRAECLLQQSATIECINKEFDDLTDYDIQTRDNTVKIHLFSNILDMEGVHFDIDHLSKLIYDTQQGVNYFVCVSAYGKDKLDDFQNSFQKLDSFKEIADCDDFCKKKSKWHIVYNIFKIDFDKIIKEKNNIERDTNAILLKNLQTALRKQAKRWY